MISRMIACLNVSHRIHTDSRYFEKIGGAGAMNLTDCNTLFDEYFGFELKLSEMLEIGVLYMQISRDHECPDHRIFSFAHVLYHLCEVMEPPAKH